MKLTEIEKRTLGNGNEIVVYELGDYLVRVITKDCGTDGEYKSIEVRGLPSSPVSIYYEDGLSDNSEPRFELKTKAKTYTTRDYKRAIADYVEALEIVTILTSKFL